jgi:endonuclease IV
MADPAVRRKLVEQIKLPEHELMKIIDKALNHFLNTLPLATQLGENLFLTALGKHSGLTGDPLMNQIISAINVVIAGQDFDDID